jgi:hypothetical protein
MSRGSKLEPEPAIWKGALRRQMKWLPSFDDSKRLHVVLFGSYGGNVLDFLPLRRKTVALMSINCVAGHTFCDKWFICDATLFAGEMLQESLKMFTSKRR